MAKAPHDSRANTDATLAGARLRPEDLASVDAVFLCNAVRGILPVARLGGRTWPPHPGTVQAQRLLAAAHPAFAPEPS